MVNLAQYMLPFITLFKWTHNTIAEKFSNTEPQHTIPSRERVELANVFITLFTKTPDILKGSA